MDRLLHAGLVDFRYDREATQKIFLYIKQRVTKLSDYRIVIGNTSTANEGNVPGRL